MNIFKEKCFCNIQLCDFFFFRFSVLLLMFYVFILYPLFFPFHKRSAFYQTTIKNKKIVLDLLSLEI